MKKFAPMYAVALDLVFFTKTEAEKARKLLANICKQKCTTLEFEMVPKRKAKGKKQ